MSEKKKSSKPVGKQVLELIKIVLEITYLVYKLIKGIGE